MINYTEKGPGLHELIRRSGWVFREENNTWTVLGDAAAETAVQALIDGYTLEHVKAAKSLEVSLHAKSLRDKVVSTISAGEMASWPIKMAEAAKFAATLDPATAPMLSAEAAKRGITLQDLVIKVGGNGANFGGLETQIGGNDGRHRDAIKLLTTFEDVLNYDFSSGWPAV